MEFVEEARAARWRMWRIEGMRRHHIRRMSRKLDGGARTFWQLEAPERTRHLSDFDFGDSTLETVCEVAAEEVLDDFRREVERLPEAAELVHVSDEAYPDRLHVLEEPPEFLYVSGTSRASNADDALSVVGSRDASVDELRRAGRIVGRVAEAGVSIVSGGAFGVDRTAHEAAMEVGGSTVVVLPSGLAEPTPKSNVDTFRRATESGAVVTEYPLDVGVRGYHFPRRNRLIAALGDAVFVVRAGKESGTMLTAEAAREIGRPLCALPGDPDDPLARGCLELIVNGAQAVRGAGDIFEQYFHAADDQEQAERAGTSARVPEGLSDDGEELYEAMRSALAEGEELLRAEMLLERTGWSHGRFESSILELELYGLCEKSGGARAYRLARRPEGVGSG